MEKVDTRNQAHDRAAGGLLLWKLHGVYLC